MKCEYCEIIDRNNDKEIIYQDDDVVVAVKDFVTITGQITVFPKKHLTILEMVPEKLLEKCTIISNKIGMAVFDGLAPQGTNVLVQNGLGAGQKVPHFGIEIIPRRENDGLDFQWEAKQFREDELDATLMTLTETLESLGQDKQKNQPESSEKIEKTGKEKKEEKKDNYLLKSIRRIP